ncbi:hypothetical protein [Plastoroseomonas hellenica]|uniref:hypothetical protein n=1 Tax=Plastoroseomonas hellenica TaxID=2687306 RepID=UPI001BAA781B|nr:hypothetical protein [Plastoroseomonas hellenica]MBR0641712.1 hypothetical protein [Plastoroseomonas hellenica]
MTIVIAPIVAQPGRRPHCSLGRRAVRRGGVTMNKDQVAGAAKQGAGNTKELIRDALKR